MSRKRRKPPKLIKSHETVPPRVGKTRTWTPQRILGIILGIVGVVGLIELRPQIGVYPQEPTEKSQPFSVPFRIENSGYFSWWLEHAFCYYGEVKVGGLSVHGSTSHSRGWNRHTLDRSESETIACNLAKSPVMPSSADIAVVIDYRPWKAFPWTFRRYFRFKGAYIDNWQWLGQPSEEIQKDADAAIEDYMRKTPSSR